LPAPPSILFPYTTLFRSDGHEFGNDQKPKKRGVSWLVYILTILIVGGGTFVGTSYVLTGRLPGQSVITGSSGTALTTSEIQKIQDRKSTRLNSSHVSISY